MVRAGVAGEARSPERGLIARVKNTMPSKEIAVPGSAHRVARSPLTALLACLGSLALLAGLAACAEADAAAESAALEETATITVEELAAGEQSAALELALDGPLGVEFRRLTIPPGLGTGRHCHHGNLIAVVEQGTLTHFAPIYPDGVHEYRAGDSIFEGAGYVHEGKNEGEEDVILLVTYLTPVGEPLAETQLQLCDAAS